MSQNLCKFLLYGNHSKVKGLLQEVRDTPVDSREGGGDGIYMGGNTFLKFLNKPMQTKSDLACVTETTHDIRVYGLCDGARFAVP